MSGNSNGLRGRVAIVGVGETTYYKHGKSPDPEFMLALKAILNACADAGIDPREIDGFCSFSDDRNDPSRLAAALGVHDLRLANMQWGGGGGGGAAATGNAAAAIAAGAANVVVVYRALAQGEFGRFGVGAGYGQAIGDKTVSGEAAFRLPYGLIAPVHRHVLKVRRFMHEHSVKQEALRAIALTSYRHAQSNPRAIMRGRPLDEKTYDESRWIVEPFHLYDCCQENDGAAALVLVSADRARHAAKKAAYILGVAQGSQYRCGSASFNTPDFGSANFKTVTPRLYEMARVGPADIGVVQAYEHFTGGVVMSLSEHGFFAPEEANDFLKVENLVAPSGRLPLNTSGGNLAECYMHGLGLQIEAVRQIRGESVNQVVKSDLGLVIAGPLVTPVSSLIVGSEATL
jgi:acetyl-CoA acetyltransferase